MRVLMTGGGTGGHVNPALAIADIIKTNVPGAEIAFVGTSHGIENRLVPKEGYKLYHVEISGIRRSLSPANIKTAYRVLTAPRKAAKLIREWKPDIVIGTGGYVCWPVLRAASSMGIPSMVHEANAMPGVAVRQLQKRVDVIMTNFGSTADYLDTDRRVVRVGLPMCGEFGRCTREQARKKLGIPDKYRYVILSFGGSLGAPMVNRASLEVMRDFVCDREDILHFHASGSREKDSARKMFSDFGLDGRENLVLDEYIYDMPLKMAAADVVICRAGAMTIAEVERMKRASVLIPSPNVTDNHQFKNAKVLGDAHAAVVVEEKDMDDGRVTEAVRTLIEDDAYRERLAANAGALCDTDTGRKIFDEIASLMKKYNKPVV
ncbi:MAG: UDP-N-acetylglucosamine--N-acetylmuramyl-(pentapeptide) pyrophosphoryl-undecaprenol N-acetylglucosamine transferase [Eubacteriales bacterium]